MQNRLQFSPTQIASAIALCYFVPQQLSLEKRLLISQCQECDYFSRSKKKKENYQVLEFTH